MSDPQRIYHWFRFLSRNIKCNINTPTGLRSSRAKEYWIRSNECKGTAVRAGSPTKSDNWTICQYLYLILAIDIALFFQNNGWEGNQDGRKGQANGDQPGYEVWFNFFYKGWEWTRNWCLRCILNWSWTLSAFVVALSKKCVGYAETFQPFWPTFFAAVLWFSLHWFLCCGAFLTAIPLSSPLEAWTRMLAQN